MKKFKWLSIPIVAILVMVLFAGGLLYYNIPRISASTTEILRPNGNGDYINLNPSGFESIRVEGISTSTSASHLIDTTNNQFVAGDVGASVYNSTDSTWAIITAYNSTSDITLDTDIFVDDDAYYLYYHNWEMVDEEIPDDLDTYVGTESLTQLKDAYTLQDTAIPEGSTINSVKVYFRIYEVYEYAYYQPFLRLGSDETAGTEINPAGAEVINTYNEILARPGGGSWAVSDFDDLQVVIGCCNPIIAGANGDTQIYVEIDYTEAAPDITITPTTQAFGTVALSNTSSTAINFFAVTNNGTVAVDVTIQGSDFTGGDDTWTLSDNATVGDNIFGLKAGLDDDDDLFDIIIERSVAVTLISNLLASANQSWGLKLYMPSAVTGYDRQSMTATLTLVVSAH